GPGFLDVPFPVLVADFLLVPRVEAGPLLPLAAAHGEPYPGMGKFVFDRPRRLLPGAMLQVDRPCHVGKAAVVVPLPVTLPDMRDVERAVAEALRETEIGGFDEAPFLEGERGRDEAGGGDGEVQGHQNSISKSIAAW